MIALRHEVALLRRTVKRPDLRNPERLVAWSPRFRKRGAELVPPQAPVDATHSLLIVAAYAAILIAAAAMRTWRADVTEWGPEAAILGG